MADVSGELVKIFFELNGFFVGEGMNLLVRRARSAKTPPGNFVLSLSDIEEVQLAMVDVKAWHAEVFFPSVIKASPELFTFLKRENLERAENFSGSKNFRKITVVSRLPSVKGTLKKSVALLKEKGIDHVIEFSVILGYLVNEVKTNVNYVENDYLQLIRIFKCHDFYRAPQLELFNSEKRFKPGTSRSRVKNDNLPDAG